MWCPGVSLSKYADTFVLFLAQALNNNHNSKGKARDVHTCREYEYKSHCTLWSKIGFILIGVREKTNDTSVKASHMQSFATLWGRCIRGAAYANMLGAFGGGPLWDSAAGFRSHRADSCATSSLWLYVWFWTPRKEIFSAKVFDYLSFIVICSYILAPCWYLNGSSVSTEILPKLSSTNPSQDAIATDKQSMIPSEFCFSRGGKTTWNAKRKRYCGPTSYPRSIADFWCRSML